MGVTGPPAMLEVSPEEETTIKNGSPTSFNVQVLDAAGNPTTEPKLILTAKVTDHLFLLPVINTLYIYLCY